MACALGAREGRPTTRYERFVSASASQLPALECLVSWRFRVSVDQSNGARAPLLANEIDTPYIQGHYLAATEA